MTSGPISLQSPTGNNSDLWLSKDLCVIAEGENYLLLEPSLPCVLLVNPSTLAALKAFQKGDSRHLLPGSFLFQSLVDGAILRKKNWPKSPVKPPVGFDPDGVSLFLTTRCSMRCIYCYSNGGEKNQKMPWEIARTALDWIMQHTIERGRKQFAIRFHGGGDPIMAFKLLKRCVIYTQEKNQRLGLKARIESGLNGVMGHATVDWICRHTHGATLSLDGSAMIHNRQRPLCTRRPSYKMVAATLKKMDAHGFAYGLRLTVTADGVPRLAESIEDICKNFAVKTIQAEPVFLAGRALENRLEPVDPKAFVEGFRKAATVAAGNGRQLTYSGARFPHSTPGFCKAVSGGSLAVTSDGLVTACYEVNSADDRRAGLFIFGRFDEKKQRLILDEEKIGILQSLTAKNKPFCGKCFCRFYCAGDCPAKLALLGDARDPSSSPRCFINQELTKDQIRAWLQKDRPARPVGATQGATQNGIRSRS
jgi:uncharacterized protein